MKTTLHPTSSQRIRDAWTGIVQPAAKPRGLLEFCRTLRVETYDPLTGEKRWEPFNPESHPAQREILHAFLSGGYDELVVLGPVQDGKTFATIVCGLLYCLIELKQSAGLMLPEQDKAEEVWLEKIVPVIRQSGYGWILPTEGRGAKGSAARFQQLNTGATVYLIGAGARNESAQSSFTVRFMFADEASSTRPRLIELAWARTASFDTHGRRLRTSTIKHDEGDHTALAYADSTQTRNWFRCAHCIAANHPSGGWQPFDFSTEPKPGEKQVLFDRFVFDADTDDTARATAAIVCVHDPAHRITEEQRRAALRTYRAVSAGQTIDAHGVVTGNVVNARKGIRWCSLESPIKTMGKLAVDLRKALIQRDRHGSHEQVRQFVRDECVQPYTADREAPEEFHTLRCTYLAARSAASTYAVVESLREPDGDSRHIADHPKTGVEWLTVGVDVNPGGSRAPGRLYWVMTGSSGNGTTWDLAWGTVALSRPGTEANVAQLHDGCTRLYALTRDLAVKSGLPLAAVGIDVGDRQEDLRSWLTKHPEWQALKDIDRSLSVETTYSFNGQSLDKPLSRADTAGYLYWRWQKDGWWLGLIDLSEARYRTQMSYLVPSNEPGASLLPAGLTANETILAHYCATGRIPDGRGSWRWADRKADRALWPDYQVRHDYLSCRTYAEALNQRHRRLITARAAQKPRKTGVVGSFV